MEFKDIIYKEANGVATITINRPNVYNAFTANTCEELIKAFGLAGWNKDIGVVVLTGAGEKAFCTGGDQSGDGYNGRGTVGLPIEELQSIIRDIPKPVIARVNGYAIGGGNVLVTICDLAIASETAIFGQVGPKVGSVDPGFGTAYLARIIGEKRAREIWYLCRKYSARQALDWGAHLQNLVTPLLRFRVELFGRYDSIDEPHRHCAGQALVQYRHREHSRNRRVRDASACHVLRHRRVEGRRQCVPRKAQAGVPQVREVRECNNVAAGSSPSPSRSLPKISRQL